MGTWLLVSRVRYLHFSLAFLLCVKLVSRPERTGRYNGRKKRPMELRLLFSNPKLGGCRRERKEARGYFTTPSGSVFRLDGNVTDKGLGRIVVRCAVLPILAR